MNLRQFLERYADANVSFVNEVNREGFHVTASWPANPLTTMEYRNEELLQTTALDYISLMQRPGTSALSLISEDPAMQTLNQSFLLRPKLFKKVFNNKRTSYAFDFSYYFGESPAGHDLFFVFKKGAQGIIFPLHNLCN